MPAAGAGPVCLRWGDEKARLQPQLGGRHAATLGSSSAPRMRVPGSTKASPTSLSWLLPLPVKQVNISAAGQPAATLLHRLPASQLPRLTPPPVLHPRRNLWQVKEVKVDEAGQRSSDAELERVRGEAGQRHQALEQWCITSYGEAFSSWIHVCTVRLFVESILRYGLPPQVRRSHGRRLWWRVVAGQGSGAEERQRPRDTSARQVDGQVPLRQRSSIACQACVQLVCVRAAPHRSPPPAPPQFLSVLMRPNPKTTAKLRKLLAQQFGHGVGSEHFSAEGGAGEDMYPYVCFTLSVE